MKTQLIIVAFLLLGILKTYAQSTKRNSITIGTTFINSFDNQWSIVPTTNFRKNTGFRPSRTIIMPPLTYRRRLNGGNYFSYKMFSSFGSAPSAYRHFSQPYAMYRRIKQAQVTMGKAIQLRSLHFMAHTGLAYQNSDRLHFLYDADHSGGWKEAIVSSSRKSSMGIPVELSVHRVFFDLLNIGFSGNYTYTFSDFKYGNIPWWKKSERHSLLLSLFVGVEFGK
jgi:hypothetical protein